MTITRYAIYAAPNAALADAGAQWLGWDAAKGQTVPHLTIPGLNEDPEHLTQTPRKYGFHGTLKPPFRLAPGKSQSALEEKLERFAASEQAVTLDALETSRIGQFIAMVPKGDTTALSALAGNIVRQFDEFRADPPAEELERRRSKGLSIQQEANLMAWGYPYVFDEFRFHLTLTGSVPENVASAIIRPLADIFDPLAKPFKLQDIALFGEENHKQFHLIRRFPFPNS